MECKQIIAHVLLSKSNKTLHHVSVPITTIIDKNYNTNLKFPFPSYFNVEFMSGHASTLNRERGLYYIELKGYICCIYACLS